MPSQVEICNMALDFLGQTVTIASLTEASKAARACARHYDQVQSEMFALHPWPFATRAIALAEVSDTPHPGWAYQYAYPAGCARAWRVCPEDGVRMQSQALWRCPDPDRVSMVDRVPFEVVYGSQQTCLVTDLSEAWLIYTVMTGEARFTPLFCAAFAWALAARIAMPITVEPAIMQNALQQAQIASLTAQAEGFNEGVPDPTPTTPSLQARG